MKFMKLGSKPDTFQAEGNCVRFVSSELETDVIINVEDVKFYLHKFPLLSKSNRLQTILSKDNDEIQLLDFPGGPKAFEICAKFCYGMIVTLNAYNVVAARCAAEYLEMTEDLERGNLILKIEIFLNSSILRSWKDSIIVLQTTKSLLPLSQNLKIVGRCIDSIVSKTLLQPSAVKWSYTCNRKLKMIQSEAEKMESVPKDWWIEDVCELEIDLYKRVIIAIKSKHESMIVEALKTYAIKWLPDSVDVLVSEDQVIRNKYLLETIVYLLPLDEGTSCSFLLKLLKVAVFLHTDDPLIDNLIKSVSSKLDEACVGDLLIQLRNSDGAFYNIELVQRLMDQFMANGIGLNKSEFVSRLLKVAKILDGYLAAIAHDPNLTLSSFITLAQSIPDSARPDHDGLYTAINIYLKEHGTLTKPERKSLCGLMDVRKFTTTVSLHAVRNDLLPLRMVVRVLFYEQKRTAGNSQENCKKITSSENQNSLRKQLNDGDENGNAAKKGSKTVQLLPLRSRRIFDRLWTVGKGIESGAENNNKSSETSGSSQSPNSTMKSSRNRRHSIS